MPLPSPLALGAIYGLSEVCLALTRRSRGRGVSRDRHSLALLWGVILVSVGLSIVAPDWFPEAALPNRRGLYLIGLGLFLWGVILRWYSIWYLGRYFTVDVAIAKEHRVINAGPYRLSPHSSSPCSRIAFLGFGSWLGNWLSILCLMLPIVGAFIWRIHVEERALTEALGDDYRAYMRRTNGLVHVD